MKITITIELDERELIEEEIEEYGYDGDDRMELSEYARVFDEVCYGWTKDPEKNMQCLKMTQCYLNQRFKQHGYLFLNDVYRQFGMKEFEDDRRFIGWIYNEENPVGDNYIDLGIYMPLNRNFVKGKERNAILDFNVDGNILKYLK